MIEHPCQDKCPEYQDEQCCHCLISPALKTPTSDEEKFLRLSTEAKKEIS